MMNRAPQAWTPGFLHIEELQKHFRRIRNGGCAGLFHIRHLAVAPGDTNGGNPVGSSADHVKGGIADHNGVCISTDLFQKECNHIAFADVGLVKGRAADAVKKGCQVKMLQDLNSGDLRLGGGDI